MASSFHSVLPEVSHGLIAVAVLAFSAVTLLFLASAAVFALRAFREWVLRVPRRRLSRPQPAKVLQPALERRV